MSPYPQRPAAPNGPGHCPHCRAAVIWCLTDANRVPMAVDRERDETGNIAVRTDVTGRWRCRQLAGERPTPEGGENLHQPHIATCASPPARTTRRRLSAGKVRTGVRPVRWQS